jgi:hypothetical protein
MSLKTTFAIFIALWLPLQAVAGIVIATNVTHEQASMKIAALSSRDQAVLDDCPKHHQVDDTMVKDTKLSAKCNHCGVCNLAATGCLLSSEPVLPLFELAQDVFLQFKAILLSYIPEPLQPPPKQLS